MTLVYWILLLSVFLVFFRWATNLLKIQVESNQFDAGLAIIEFGQAYPDEAIRHVLMSSDGKMVFLRLWTGRTGLMRRVGNRQLCYLVDPNEVRVSPRDDGISLEVLFPDMKHISGTFAFRSEKEAAEVGIWLLGSVAVSIPQEHPLPDRA